MSRLDAEKDDILQLMKMLKKETADAKKIMKPTWYECFITIDFFAKSPQFKQGAVQKPQDSRMGRGVSLTIGLD